MLWEMIMTLQFTPSFGGLSGRWKGWNDKNPWLSEMDPPQPETVGFWDLVRTGNALLSGEFLDIIRTQVLFEGGSYGYGISKIDFFSFQRKTNYYLFWVFLEKKASRYQKLFWPFTVWINCSSDLNNFLS